MMKLNSRLTVTHARSPGTGEPLTVGLESAAPDGDVHARLIVNSPRGTIELGPVTLAPGFEIKKGQVFELHLVPIEEKKCSPPAGSATAL